MRANARTPALGRLASTTDGIGRRSGIPTPTPGDWIGLYVPGSGNTTYLAWIRVSCSQSPGAASAAGSCPFTIPSGLAPGSYELRLYANDTYTRLATSNPFDVTP